MISIKRIPLIYFLPFFYVVISFSSNNIKFSLFQVEFSFVRVLYLTYLYFRKAIAVSRLYGVWNNSFSAPPLLSQTFHKKDNAQHHCLVRLSFVRLSFEKTAVHWEEQSFRGVFRVNNQRIHSIDKNCKSKVLSQAIWLVNLNHRV